MSFLGLDWTVWAVLVPAFVFFVWHDRRKKARHGDRATPGMIFIPVPGQRARKSPWGTLFVIIAVLVGLVMAKDWLTGHWGQPPR